VEVNVIMRFSDFSGAKFNNAELTGAKLKDSNFKFSDLRSANLRCEGLETCNLENAIFSEDPVWPTDFNLDKYGVILK